MERGQRASELSFSLHGGSSLHEANSLGFRESHGGGGRIVSGWLYST